MGREQGGQGLVESNHVSAMGSMGGILEGNLRQGAELWGPRELYGKRCEIRAHVLRIERRKSFQPGWSIQVLSRGFRSRAASLLALGQSASVSMILRRKLPGRVNNVDRNTSQQDQGRWLDHSLGRCWTWSNPVVVIDIKRYWKP